MNIIKMQRSLEVSSYFISKYNLGFPGPFEVDEEFIDCIPN